MHRLSHPTSASGRPTLDPLESRQMLAVVIWDGGPAGTGTDFNTATNWVGDVLPGPADTALINSAGNTITFSGSTRTITNLETSRDIQFSSGSLVTSGTNSITSAIRMHGGTLNGGVWNFSGTGAFIFTNSGGTLDNLSTASDLVVGAASAIVTLSGTTTSGTIRLSGNGSTVTLASGFVLNSNVVAEGSGTGIRSIMLGAVGDNAITIGSSATVLLSSSASAGLRIQSSSAVALINNGTIVNANASQTLTINAFTFTNAQILRAASGPLTVSSGGGWLNLGTIEAAAGSIVNVGGTFNTTNGEGIFATSAGRLQFTGTVLNTGNIFDISPTTTGNLYMSGGTVNGGSIAATDGATIAISAGGTFASVIISCEVHVNTLNARVLVSGATTFSLLRLSASGTMLQIGTGFTLSNPVIAEGEDLGSRYITLGSAGPGNVVISTTGSVTRAIGFAGVLYVTSSTATTLVNYGLIENNSSQGHLQLGADLNAFTNADTGVVRANAGRILVYSWSTRNMGTIENVAGSTIEFGGTFITSNGIGTFNTAAGTVLMRANVNNVGGTITMNATTGSWRIAGSTIEGGVLILDGAAPTYSQEINTLRNVTVIGELVMSIDNEVLHIAGTTSFYAARMRASGRLVLMDGFVLRVPIICEGMNAGNRVIDINDNGTAGTRIASNGSITAASGLQGNVYIISQTFGSLVNEGLIVNYAAGRSTTVFVNRFVNAPSGVIRAPVGSVRVGSSSWSNEGTIENAIGSSVTLLGELQTSGGIGNFQTAAGRVFVSGTINIVGSTLTLNEHTGDWELDGGTVRGGSFVLNGYPLTISTSRSTLSDVNIIGTVLMNVSQSELVLVGSTTFTQLRMTASGASLYLTTGFTLSSPVIIDGAASGDRTLWIGYGSAGAATVGQSGSITLLDGAGGNVIISQEYSASLVNNGVIRNQASGRTFFIQISGFSNNGAIEAYNSIIEITTGSRFVNAGAIQIGVGGLLRVHGVQGFANAATGTVNITLGGPLTSQYGRLQTTAGHMLLGGTLSVSIADNVTLPIVSKYDIISVPANRIFGGAFVTINQPLPGPDGKNFFLISSSVYSFAYSSRADINNDASVDFFDYLDFVAAFSTNNLMADFNNDFAIDFGDYLDFVVIFSRF